MSKKENVSQSEASESLRRLWRNKQFRRESKDLRFARRVCGTTVKAPAFRPGKQAPLNGAFRPGFRMLPDALWQRALPYNLTIGA